MRFQYALLLIAAALVGALACPGCGDRVVFVKEGTDPGLVSGDIDPHATGFQIVVDVAGTATDPIRGPFVIEGSNIHYDTGAGVLMVDLTVTNNTTQTHPLPVRLEFVALWPTGVLVMNPSNGVYGPGAMIEFMFENDDLAWTPGETSLPRNVQFKVRPGVSIGFAARLHVGPLPHRGSIGGVVWADYNENGVRDSFEHGIAGRQITLVHTDSTFDCATVLGTDCVDIRHTTTGTDGRYRFGDLVAGHYTVILVRDRCSAPTTPTEIEVILVETGAGGVGNFMLADFGVLPMRGCW